MYSRDVFNTLNHAMTSRKHALSYPPASPQASSSSHAMVTPNFHIPSGILNIVGANQYNISHIHDSSNRPPAPQVPFIEVPVDLSSIKFTGRKKELALITKAFERPRRNIPLRCVLFGDHGVGKSHLTYKWAGWTFSQNVNAYVLWISATTVEKLCQGFCKLLLLVNHPDRSHPEQSVRLTAARRWLEEVDTGNWLLVLDNVLPDALDFLRQHLPRQNGRGSILFTTRTERVAGALASTAGEQHEVIEVPLLDVQDGVKLFLGHFNNGDLDDPPSAKVEKMVKSVGCLPLAIAHATAYMKKMQYTVDDMLEFYQSERKIDVSPFLFNFDACVCYDFALTSSLLRQLISWENNLSEYEYKSVAATFTCQLRGLERQHPDASKLLRVLAFFDPEKIPIEMLVAGAKSMRRPPMTPDTNTARVPRTGRSLMQKIKSVLLRRRLPGTTSQPNKPDPYPYVPPTTASLLALIQSPLDFRNAITQLQSQSLIAYQHNCQPPTLRMHDLIQLVVLEGTKSRGDYYESFEFAVELACNAFKQIGNHYLPEWWPQCELLVPHIQTLTAREDISPKAKALLLVANHRRAMYLVGRGRYVEAETLYARLIAEREKLFGAEDVERLRLMHNLAGVCISQGRYNDAEILLEQVLLGRENRLGPEHRETLKTMDQLAVVHHRQGRYDAAVVLLKQTLRIQKQGKRYGSARSNSASRLRTMHVLARVYGSQERYDRAEALFKRVLLAREKLLGFEHVETLTTMYELAVIYQSQQHHHEAKELLTKVLRARESHLGSEHHDTLATKHVLAKVYHSQGSYDAAEALFRQVLTAMEKHFGSQHPDVLTTMYCLADVCQSRGRCAEARELLEHVLGRREVLLGLSHRDTQDTIELLASVYEKLRAGGDSEVTKEPVLPSPP